MPIAHKQYKETYFLHLKANKTARHRHALSWPNVPTYKSRHCHYCVWHR